MFRVEQSAALHPNPGDWRMYAQYPDAATAMLMYLSLRYTGVPTRLIDPKGNIINME